MENSMNIFNVFSGLNVFFVTVYHCIHIIILKILIDKLFNIGFILDYGIKN